MNAQPDAQPNLTELVVGVDVGLDESMTDFLKSRVERSAQNIKDLVEAEVEK